MAFSFFSLPSVALTWVHSLSGTLGNVPGVLVMVQSPVAFSGGSVWNVQDVGCEAGHLSCLPKPTPHPASK